MGNSVAFPVYPTGVLYSFAAAPSLLYAAALPPVLAFLCPADRRLYSNASAAKEASSAAPRVPPTAPPTTAVLLLGQCVTAGDVAEENGALGTSIEVDPEGPTETVCVGSMILPMPVVMWFEESSQQSPFEPKSRQQYTPRLHSKTSRLIADPVAKLKSASSKLFCLDDNYRVRRAAGIRRPCPSCRYSHCCTCFPRCHRLEHSTVQSSSRGHRPFC